MARRDRPTYADGQGLLFAPESNWTRPTELPQIPSGATIALDTETLDTGITSGRGAGWAYKDGHLSGYSVAWRAGGEIHSSYIPIQHPDTDNFDKTMALGHLQDILNRAGRVVFHSESYDMGWLGCDGITVDQSKCDDVHAQAVMIDENQLSYNLDSVARRAGVPGKDERKLREAAAALGFDAKRDLGRMPAMYVGEYAEQDAVSTLLAEEVQRPILAEQGLTAAYRLEMDLIPMTIAMRRRGIRIDRAGAERAQSELVRRRDERLSEIARQLGWREFSMEHANSPGHLERAFDQEQVPYPRTPKTQRGSFKSDWMRGAEHWLPAAVAEVRQISDMAEKFLGTYILDSMHLGRIHAEINQLRDDESGTRSYRLSYSNPPLQQIPGRDPVLTEIIRGAFLAERGCLWGSGDYSQQEPRLAVHFASLCGCTGAADAVAYYAEREDADFHTMVSELTGVPRKQAKIINLGLMYGMGLAKLAASLGVTMVEAASIIEQYHARMPFVQGLSEFCTKRATKRGYVRLLDGARCRFDEWEPAWRPADEPWSPPLPHGEAVAKWPGRRLRRCYTHKAMNRLIQGSAARQTKMAMLACWQEGILPLLQMHDELDFSLESEALGIRAATIMREIVHLRVPMKVDMQFGRNWGEASVEPPKGALPPSWQEIMRRGL